MAEEWTMGTLREVDAVEVISLVDNHLEASGASKREDVKHLLEWTPNPDKARPPRAEHGLSCLVRTHSELGTHTILLDVAFEPGSVADNAQRMGLDLSPTEAIVLSHQHWDHTGGLVPVLKTLHAAGLPVIVHPDTFHRRAWRDPEKPDAEMRESLPAPTREEAETAGARIVESTGPYLLCDNTILVMGEVPRLTDFEPGLPHEWVMRNGEWQHDPRVIDDRSIVMHVRGKGLVIVSGCAHSGIVNTVRHARKLTGVADVAAILGGFHLAGKPFEENIPHTVAALKELEPDLLVPSHCTGWSGRFALAQAFPAAFVPNSVGNLYRIAAPLQ